MAPTRAPAEAAGAGAGAGADIGADIAGDDCIATLLLMLLLNTGAALRWPASPLRPLNDIRGAPTSAPRNGVLTVGRSVAVTPSRGSCGALAPERKPTAEVRGALVSGTPPVPPVRAPPAPDQ